ncbi:MAG: 4-(cytidine 5'-diphospho)-2-C-methyl-D-erythritol kinase [Flavobacteriales bacterium]|nr:4-diphosphocytidyl-2-C-methyl-D-erythritol kinase [Flavobacteriales bacterium]MCC6578718.1 4-(cytidine 5'-diphospho)-2-C-methyl-D-erythritol kinase [Flavobacteriales bacterium]NUQ15944.1 4-(cytidine 5'-diphospho)-2-C-methyl-D-erythritol kinase [Flavobacteriales bacterium]
MLTFPCAKINLGLNVLRVRDDGYRDIESVLVPIPLCDALEAVVDPALGDGRIAFVRTGRAVPGDPYDDLVVRAHGLVNALRPLPGLRVHLHKVLPIGAGLGGGSSDGAHMLLLLDRLLGLGLGRAVLHELAAQLGSDPPFFLHGVPCLAEGRGERLTPLPLALEGHWLVLVDPGIHVGTAGVYARTQPTGRSVDLAAVLAGPVGTWQGRLVNVMEEAVFAMHPSIGHLKEALLAAGAAYASMSGSGSSVYGIFTERPRPGSLALGAPHRLLPLGLGQ